MDINWFITKLCWYEVLLFIIPACRQIPYRVLEIQPSSRKKTSLWLRTLAMRMRMQKWKWKQLQLQLEPEEEPEVEVEWGACAATWRAFLSALHFQLYRAAVPILISTHTHTHGIYTYIMCCYFISLFLSLYTLALQDESHPDCGVSRRRRRRSLKKKICSETCHK